jgi:hypothetical protein
LHITLQKKTTGQLTSGHPESPQPPDVPQHMCLAIAGEPDPLTRISMVPLEILVVMPKAWKKEVFSGPRPVFWAGTVTSHGAMAPARAAAGT